MGELHLEIIVDRLMREFRVDANVGRPQVAYRETVVAGRREGPGQVRPADRRLGPVRRRRHQPDPQEPGDGLRVRRQDRRREDPEGVHQAGRRGHPGGASSAGVLAGYPVVDVKVELVEGSYHEVDSSERAFKIAGSMAFKEAMKRAKPKLLEPTMAVEVVTPEDYLGDVMGNLNWPPRPGRAPRAARQLAVDQGERAARRRCSATPPTCARCPRVGRRSRCSSTATKTFPRPSRPRSSTAQRLIDR